MKIRISLSGSGKNHPVAVKIIKQLKWKKSDSATYDIYKDSEDFNQDWADIEGYLSDLGFHSTSKGKMSGGSEFWKVYAGPRGVKLTLHGAPKTRGGERVGMLDIEMKDYHDEPHI